MEKKLFSFWLKEDVKERLKELGHYRGDTVAFEINEAIKKHLEDWDNRRSKHTNLTP